MIQLENFSGWEPGDQWGDVSFFFRHDQDIERIAIVCEPRWRDQMQAFLFADYRLAEARFFAETGLDSGVVDLDVEGVSSAGHGLLPGGARLGPTNAV